MASNFIHLHCHSEYSLLDGLSKVKSLVSRVKELEMPAVALTDHGVMYGAIEFYKACNKEGVKPLIGMEGYVVNGDHKKKDGKEDAGNNHLVLISKNYEGYRNLMKLTTIAHLEGYYYRPRVSKEVLRQYSKGLICLSACPKGEIAEQLIAGNYEAAKKTVEWYQEVFGPENYFLEIQRHFYKDYWNEVKNNNVLFNKLQYMQKTEDIWVDGVVKLSREFGIPLVATNDAHYIKQDDATAQDALVCISTGKNVSDTDRLRYIDTPTFYLATEDEMKHSFPDFPEAVTNTTKVAELVDLKIELGKWYFPNIQIPAQKTPEQYLREIAQERLPTKYPNANQAVVDRLNYELDIICDKGYASYFLLLGDMVNWCSDHGIITNTRGSAAGSIATYIVGITTVDPLRYALPFERFLNPFRPSAPDIDLDIADDRREELISYVTAKYGLDKVAQICTFGRMLARAAVRDVCRVLGHPYSFGDRIAKVIPIGSQGFPMTIERALSESPELKIMYDSDPAVKQAIDLARQIEGNARHLSVHAAGTVVSPSEMTDYSPLQLEPSGEKIITQYEFHACEDVGLVKFDILGIRNLSILGAARDIVESTRNTKINLAKLPVDDAKTFAMLARGETMGVFQLGGTGMTKWLKELKPTRLEDIMIMIALFRPGPMANIPEFIARKNRRSPVTFIHPKMSKFLDKSFGILVYQEDIMFTALEMAGYTWETVDNLRKAIGKKLPKEMAAQHEIFVKGCIENSNMTKEEAEKIWDLFVPFQGYGFNKAHAASYGIVSYQTAYLKAHYPVEYMTALLTAEAGNTEKIVEAVDECRRMRIKVLAPDVNKSHTGFTIEEDKNSLDNRAIRFGLSAIKNVGETAIASILSARANGPFTSLTDFILRVDSQKVNRKVLESLVKSGALDSFGKRAAMLAALDKIREMGTSISKLKSLGQVTLFGEEENVDTSDKLPDVAEFDKPQKLNLEKELLGFYLTEHPHGEKLTQIGSLATHKISQLYSEDLVGQTITLGGIIESVRNVTTKTNNLPMCFCRISDLTRSIEAVVFPKVYAATSSVWQPENVVIVSGKVDSRTKAAEASDEEGDSNSEITILIDSAATFIGPNTTLPQIAGTGGGYRSNHSSGNGNGHSYSNGNNSNRSKYSSPEPASKGTPVISIYVPKGTPSSVLVRLNNLLQANKGDQPAQLVFANNGTGMAKTIPLPYGLEWSNDLKAKIDTVIKT